MSMHELKFERSDAIGQQGEKGKLVNITKVTCDGADFLAYAYRCELRIDYDGSPTCYGWSNPAQPLDHPQRHVSRDNPLSNACDPTSGFHLQGNGGGFTWVGLYAATQDFARTNGFLEALDTRQNLRDAHNKYPVVQQNSGVAQGPSPGNYVSTTGVPARSDLDEWRQERYINAKTIPYAVRGGQSWGKRIAKKDCGLAIHNASGSNSGFLFGDTRGFGVGEVSVKLHDDLTGGRGGVSFIVFPGTSSISVIEEGAINVAVGTQLRKLQGNANAIGLGLLLTLGFDHPDFVAYRNGTLKAERLSEIESSAEFNNLRCAFFEWGIIV